MYDIGWLCGKLVVQVGLLQRQSARDQYGYDVEFTSFVWYSLNMLLVDNVLSVQCYGYASFLVQDG